MMGRFQYVFMVAAGGTLALCILRELFVQVQRIDMNWLLSL